MSAERPAAALVASNGWRPSEHTLAVAIPPGLVDLIAERAAALVTAQLGERSDDRWLDTRGAAEYLGLTPNALHKLTAAREIPFSQDAPGGKCWFLRSELDAWRREGR
jgi:excisionase family DNA binding protein